MLQRICLFLGHFVLDETRIPYGAGVSFKFHLILPLFDDVLVILFGF